MLFVEEKEELQIRKDVVALCETFESTLNKMFVGELVGEQCKTHS